jgi:hypothetical protein
VKRRRILKDVSIWLACAALVVGSGCQRADGLARLAVFGTVTSPSDVPINGMISFLPEAGTSGPAATASLVDGVFRFDTNNGPVAGKYRVLVVKSVPDRKQKGASEAPQGAGPPPVEEWSFTADVSPGKIEFDFPVPDASTATKSG